MEINNQIQLSDQGTFSQPGNFEHAQRVAKMLSASPLVPKDFQGNIQNVMIALEISTRIGASPLMVMQNLYIVHGKPSWSSSFIIAAINACKRFSPLRFEMSGTGDDYGCTAWAYDLDTKDKLEGPKVTKRMVDAEGWATKNGSKWKTMPELMYRYRAAAFFGRLYAPDILMGMHTQDEVVDIQPISVETKIVDKEAERIELMINDAKTVEELKTLEPHILPTQTELFETRLSQLKTA